MKTNTERLVNSIMSANVMTVDKDDLLYDAIRKMEIESMSVLPVVDQSGKVCGILSSSDLIGKTYNLQCDVSVLSAVPDYIRKSLTEVLAEDNCETKVSSVMTDSVETITSNSTISGAAQLLVNNDIHHLPVVDDVGIPIGIISAMDIVRAVAFPN